jgi:hypothetical protein
MERVPFTVAKNALLPAGDESSAVLQRLAIGGRVQVEIYQERSTLANRAALVFERIGKALGNAQSTTQRLRLRNIRGWVLAGTGRCDLAHIDGGRMALIPWSTSAMTAAEFEAFWEDGCEFIAREILPTLLPGDRDEIARLIVPQTGESRPASASS